MVDSINVDVAVVKGYGLPGMPDVVVAARSGVLSRSHLIYPIRVLPIRNTRPNDVRLEPGDSAQM